MIETRRYCKCDACSVSVQIVDKETPDRWVSVEVNQHGSRTQHFCPECWSAGYCRMLAKP